MPVHGVSTLLADFGALTVSEVTLPGSPDDAFPILATPSPLHGRAFELLGVAPPNVAMQKPGSAGLKSSLCHSFKTTILDEQPREVSTGPQNCGQGRGNTGAEACRPLPIGQRDQFKSKFNGTADLVT